MSLDNSHKIIFVIGANRGIGLETSRQLARRGWHVVLGARDEAGGRQAAEAVGAEAGRRPSCPLT